MDDPKAFIANTSLKTLEGPSRTSHIILWISFLFILMALFWSDFAILDEVTAGRGKVIPSRQIQVIQNLEGGIVREILVHEGQIVDNNQILMKIDDTRFSSTYKESEKKIGALVIKAARLKSEIESVPFTVPAEYKTMLPDIYADQISMLNSRLAERKQLENELALAVKEYNMTKPLVKKGAASEIEILHLDKTISEVKGKLLNFKNTALHDLNETKSQLSPLQEAFVADKDRLTRTTVRAPLKGIIKTIKINTIGGVVQPGMELVEIVPLDDTLLLEAKIRPADIGFLHPGQKAMVKLSAYDFSIYGGLEGTVERISADTIAGDKEDESYYLIYVRTQKNYLGTKAKPLYIIPGMLASVDVLTGEKSVLSYILKPILKAKNTALRER